LKKRKILYFYEVNEVRSYTIDFLFNYIYIPHTLTAFLKKCPECWMRNQYFTRNDPVLYLYGLILWIYNCRRWISSIRVAKLGTKNTSERGISTSNRGNKVFTMLAQESVVCWASGWLLIRQWRTVPYSCGENKKVSWIIYFHANPIDYSNNDRDDKEMNMPTSRKIDFLRPINVLAYRLFRDPFLSAGGKKKDTLHRK